MKHKKITSSIVASLLLFLLINASVSASPIADTQKSTPISISNSINPDLLENGGKITITNKSELKRLAIKEGLNAVPLKVEYDYQPSSSNSPMSESVMSDFTFTPLTTYNYVGWVGDEGNGWYFPGNPYQTFTIDGPDTFIISKTESQTSTWSGTSGVTLSVLSAAVGFTIGSSNSVTWTSNTPVPAGQTLSVELYTTYHRKDFLTYSGPDEIVADANMCTGSGETYWPNGTYIKKTFYATP